MFCFLNNLKYSKIKFLTFFAIICSIGLAPINDASAAENTVTATITVGDRPYGIEFDSANNRMYVANLNDDTVSVIDTSDYSVIDANGVAAGTAIAVGDGPRDIEFDSANNRMYVANFNDDTVSVIDISDNTVTATITVGDRPYGIAFDSANNRMYVVNSNDDPVSVIDISDNTVTATITVGNGPRAIAFDSANNRMYVTNSNDDTVSVIDIAPPSSSSGCYDCTPPVLQNAHITILTNNYVVSTDDKPIHITANVGDEISIVLKITDNKSIDGITFVGIYTNFIEKPSDMNLFYANNFDNLKNISTSFYEWNVNSDDVAYDYDGTVSWSNGMPTVTDDLILGEYLMVPFTMTFTDSMDTSQITIKSFDASGNSLHVTLPVTLEIITKETILLSESEEMATLDKGDVIVTPSEDTTPLLNESVLLTVLSQWSGYSQVTSNDAEVLSVMGLHGDSLPAWTKHLGEWVIQEKLDVSELITAIQYVNDN